MAPKGDEMRDVNTFAVTAWPAAGKSVATREIVSELNHRGMHVVLYSDKEALLTQVAYEIEREGKSLQTSAPIEVENFTLLNPSEPRVSWGIKFKHAETLNEAHRKLFEILSHNAKTLDHRTKTVVELAYGENAVYPDGPLRQNAKDFLDQLEETGVLGHTAFVDVYARMQFRRPRNKGRIHEVGYIPDEEFVKYFRDKGGWTLEDQQRLDGRFTQITNELIPKWYYRHLVREKTGNFIVPLIHGESAGGSKERLA